MPKFRHFINSEEEVLLFCLSFTLSLLCFSKEFYTQINFHFKDLKEKKDIKFLKSKVILNYF